MGPSRNRPGSRGPDHDAGAVETRQGGAWEPDHVDPVGRQARLRVDVIVVSELDLRKMRVPIVLSLVDDHCQHLGHSVVHTLNALVTIGTTGGRSLLAHAQQLMYSL